MIRIIADEKIPFLKGVLEPYAEVVYLPGEMFSREHVRNADAILIRTVTRIDGDLLEGSSVRFIGSASAGYDHVDTSYCEKMGIQWEYAPGCNAFSVFQYVCSALLSISKLTGESLQKKTIGIVGVGNVGKEIQKLAGILGMNVLLNDPPRERIEGKGMFLTYKDLVSQSDILTLHVPLNRSGKDRTYHMVDERSLSNMKKGSWLINTARGEVVDSKVIKKIKNSTGAPGLVFDVWENEPCVDVDLIPHVYLSTPHIAGYSLEGKVKGTSMVVSALGHFFNFSLNKFFQEIPPLSIERNTINIDGTGKTSEEILLAAVETTFSILEEDRRFRADPTGFERHRNLNINRREFSAYRINDQNIPTDIVGSFRKLGFLTS